MLVEAVHGIVSDHISARRAEFGDDFWGFWMLGGMSGGGMGFIFAPEKKTAAQQRMQEIMSATKHELSAALPFAIEPVVYDFAINEHGTHAELLAQGGQYQRLYELQFADEEGELVSSEL